MHATVADRAALPRTGITGRLIDRQAAPPAVELPHFDLNRTGAVALGKSEGLSRLVPAAVFLLALAASMGGLAYAMRALPIGTAYAVWVGIGASLAVVFGMVSGDESVTLMKVVLLCGLIGCVVGLKLVH